MRPLRTSRITFGWIALPTIFVFILTGIIPLLATLGIETTFDAEAYSYLGYFSTYLAVFVVIFSLREGVRYSLSEFFVWGNGFALFAGFHLMRSVLMALPQVGGSAMTSVRTAMTFELAAHFFLSFYLLLGANLSLRLKPKKIMLALVTLVLLGVTTLYLLSTKAALFTGPRSFTSLTRVLYGLSALAMLLAGGMLFRRRFARHNTSSSWLISALWLGSFVGIYSAISVASGDVFFWASQIGNTFFLTLAIVGLFAHRNRRLSVNQKMSDALQIGYDGLVLSKRGFSELVENLPEGLLIVDVANTVRFCNEAFTRLLGYELGAVVGLHLSVFLSPEDYEKIAGDTPEPEKRQPVHFELELRKKDNLTLAASLTLIPIFDERSSYAGAQLVISDLTQQRKIEKDLRQLLQDKAVSLQLFRECIEHSTEGIMITDMNAEITHTNRSFEKMIGYEKGELKGKETAMLAHDQKSILLHTRIWDSVKVGKVWRGEFITRKKDGSAFIGELAVVPIVNKRMPLGSCLWIERDVTRRKKLELSIQNYTEKLTRKTDELESSKAYYGSLISAMSDILIVVDNEGQCTFINDYGKRRLGYGVKDLTKAQIPIFFDDLRRLEKDYGQAIQVEIKDFECQIKPKEGPPILCSWYARPLFDRFKRRTGAMAVGRDITEYKKMQKELEDYAKNLEKSVEERTLELETKLTQLGKLLEIGEEIRLNGDVDVIINKICDAVQALGWRKVVISLRDYEKEVSQPVATAGLTPKQVEEVMGWRDIPFEHTDKYFQEHFRISHSYFIPQEEQYVSEKTEYSVYSNLGQGENGDWHSLDALLVPIRTKDKVLGTITVDDPLSRKRPGFDEIRDLEIFADKAAIAIENVRLFQVQKENEREAKFLADISKIFHSSLNLNEVLQAVVEKGGTTIGEFCTLLLPGGDANVLLPEATFHHNPRVVDLFVKSTEEFPCHISEGIVGSVVSSGQATRLAEPLPDEENAFKRTLFHYLEEFQPISSLMVVPLQVQGKSIGAMAYVLFDQKRRYRKEELRLAQELASRAALAIENARLFEEAGQKARELEKANRMKSEFLANVSHELRTPLNAIITLSDIMQRSIDETEPEDQRKQLEIIHRSGHNLLNLINDILDLAKVESGKIDAMYTQIPILAVVEEAIEHMRPLCIKKGLTLEHEFDKTVPEEIYSDQDKLTKALTNILSNAVKFTRTGGIKLRMKLKDKKTLAISVKDTGIGIPADRLDEIFGEFHQIDSTDSRTYGGTGLGLAITHRVLQIIGGSVTVESQLGKGSTFTIEVPLKGRKEVGELLNRNVESVPRKPEKNFALDVSDDRNKLIAAKKTVLVVDDEVESRYIISRYLREAGYQLVFLEQGEDVIALAQQYAPAAITLDIIMPQTSGWELLKCLKDDETTRDIPVVMTTILRERERAMEMGAAAYLVKPFAADELQSALNSLKYGTAKRQPRFEIPRLWGGRKKPKARPGRNMAASADIRSNGNRILLVDDDRDTQYAMGLILEGAGYNVHFANEGREALRKAEALQPNLILMDIMMPGMDGYEATRVLKAHKEFRKIPVVAMTAKAMKGDREKTILAGCDDYIAKPFVTEDILKIIRKWLSEQQKN